jgi:hypothetical protein
MRRARNTGRYPSVIHIAALMRALAIREFFASLAVGRKFRSSSEGQSVHVESRMLAATSLAAY